MIYLTAIRNYQASLRYQLIIVANRKLVRSRENAATSAKLSQEMAFNKKNGKTWRIFENPWFFLKIRFAENGRVFR